MNEDPILSRLRAAEGGAVSGAKLADEMGMTRAAVWKRIESLRKTGYGITSKKGGGYLLTSEPDLITPETMAQLLKGSLFTPDRYRYLTKTDSTNAQATLLARDGAEEGTIVVADQQTVGKGRLGRTWESPPGVNLYFSLILRPTLDPRFASQLTLVAAVALASALAGNLQVEGLDIKWPNDILLNGKKLAGILTEMSAEPDAVHYVILGIGVNVNGRVADYPEELHEIAATLYDHLDRTTPRSNVLAAFLAQFETWYGRYLKEGFAPIRNAWLAQSNVVGRPVRVNLLNESYEGTAQEMDPEGFLIVKRGNGRIEKVVSGDVLPL